MNLSKTDQQKWIIFLQKIHKDFPEVNFTKNSFASFSDNKQTINYVLKTNFLNSASSLLHELGHLIGKHEKFISDMDLIYKEVEAWEIAKKLGMKYKININDDYIDGCLDSYRDWVHKRSICPNCQQNGIQDRLNSYLCLNCSKKWSVSKSRFCRTYRKNSK